MKHKKSISLASIILATVFMCGCGDEIPDLSPSQTELVTEYSAALLLKYDSSTPSRLLPEGSVVPVQYVAPGSAGAVPVEIREDQEEGSDIPVDTEPASSIDDVTVTDAVTGESSGPSAHGEGFADFFAGSGLDVAYAGSYEVVDTYPDSEEVNPYFTVDASEGNRLLVIHFNLSNSSAEDNDVNMNTYNLRYRVSVNGGKNKFVMTTFLENDLMTYVGTLAPGESTGVVAICEISEEEAANIQSLDFTIRGEEFSTVTKLQ